MLLSNFFAVLALPLLAVATPHGTRNEPTTTVTVTETATATPTSNCNTGPIQCCNQMTTSDSTDGQTVLSGLGIVVEGANVPIGINCSPISVAGVGSNNCNATPVCCQNNSFNGLVAIGCVTVIVNA